MYFNLSSLSVRKAVLCFYFRVNRLQFNCTAPHPNIGHKTGNSIPTSKCVLPSTLLHIAKQLVHVLCISKQSLLPNITHVRRTLLQCSYIRMYERYLYTFVGYARQETCKQLHIYRHNLNYFNFIIIPEGSSARPSQVLCYFVGLMSYTACNFNLTE